MSSSSNDSIDLRSVFRSILLTALTVVLPNSGWAFLGWILIMQPLAGLVVIYRFGQRSGTRILAASLLLCIPSVLLENTLYFFLLSAVMLGSGAVLGRAARNQENVLNSGSRMFFFLAIGWGLLWYSFGLLDGPAPYQRLIAAIQQGIDEAIKFYQTSGNLDGEAEALTIAVLHQMKQTVVSVLPSVAASMVLLLTWFTMVVGNSFLARQSGIHPWGPYQNWKLPDKMIWLGIVFGILSALPLGWISFVSINSLIILGIVYCFQGLAITVYFMNTWRVPILLRSFLYVLIIFQTLGTVLLLVLGVIESWIDLRKQNPNRLDDTGQ